MGSKAAEEIVLTYNVAMNKIEFTSNFFSRKGIERRLNKILQVMRLHEQFHLNKDTGNLNSNEISYYYAQFLQIIPRLQNAQH